MRRTPLVAGVYAGVLAAVVGGTTAFARLDKTVTIVVDGQSRQVRTFARDVNGLLTRQHLRLGAHDMLSPAPGTRLSDGSTVVLLRGRPLVVTVDGTPRTVWTTAETLDQALDALALHTSGAFLSADRSTRVPLSGLSVELRLPHALTLLHDGRADRVVTTEATVGDALRRGGVAVATTDRVSVPLGARPADGLQVRITRVRAPMVVDTAPIGFGTRQVGDPHQFVGSRRTVSPGQLGASRLTYRLYVIDGRVTSRHLVSRVVTRQPRAAVVAVGTRKKPTYGPSLGGRVDELNWYALAGCESGHNPRAVNPNGHYGLYQFSLGTWESVGGSGNPVDASVSEQTYRAKLLYLRRGSSPWACGYELYT